MLTKLHSSILVLMLLWLLGGSRPVKAKQKQNNPATPETLPGQCLSDLRLDKTVLEISELFRASTNVFEAAVTSKSPPDSNAIYGVNLKLKKSFKGDIKSRNLDYIRMSFLTPGANASGCALQASLEPGKKYIVFSKEVRHRQFVPLAAPIEKTKSVVKSLKNVTCKRCEPSINRLPDIETRVGDSFQLRCVVREGPHTTTEEGSRHTSIRFAWYKNAKLVRKNRRREIKTKHFLEERKSRSILRIKGSKGVDGGLYLCRANLGDRYLETEARVTVIKTRANKQSKEDGKIMEGLECPISHFCLNGGTCVYYATIGELTCICASGYRGKRCEQKDVYETGMVWGHRVSRCVLGITHFPC